VRLVDRGTSDGFGAPPLSVQISLVLAIIVGAIVVTWVLTDPFRGFMSEGEHFGAGVRLSNKTGEDVVIEAHADNAEWIGVPAWAPADQPWNGSMDAGNWYGDTHRFGREGCTYVPLRAIGPGGDEIERREPPLCDGETWVIDGRVDAPSSIPPG
jgi:hypothetical protein